MLQTQQNILDIFSYYDRSLIDDTFYDLIKKQSIIRSSNVRLVVSGNSYEMYHYEKPYGFDYPPQPRADCVRNLDTETPRRADNLFAVRQKIRRLINANINSYGQIAKFITYTFRENETELSRANAKFREFHKRLEYKIGKLKYLAVVEFQKRGAVHYHVLYFNIPFTPNLKTLVETTWGHGFVRVVAVKKVRNLGAYVCKYLQKEIMDTRLRGQKCYFTSKGLNRPIEFKISENIAKFLSGCILQEESRKSYDSQSYGNIIYQQGLIKINTQLCN